MTLYIKNRTNYINNPTAYEKNQTTYVACRSYADAGFGVEASEIAQPEDHLRLADDRKDCPALAPKSH